MRKGNRKAGDDYIVDGTLAALYNRSVLMHFCTLIVILRITEKDSFFFKLQ